MRPALWLVRRVTWRHVSLAAALALVAQSEWQLAVLVGWPVWIAWAAPSALDAYVLAAVTARRDLGWSVTVSTASVFASHGLNHQYPDAARLPWWVVAFASAVPLLVTWRVHHLPQEQTCQTSINSDERGSRATTETPTSRTATSESHAPTAPATRSSGPRPSALSSPRTSVSVGSSRRVPAATGPSSPATATPPAPPVTPAGRPATAVEAPRARGGDDVVAKLVANGYPLPTESAVAAEHGLSVRTAARRLAKAREELARGPV